LQETNFYRFVVLRIRKFIIFNLKIIGQARTELIDDLKCLLHSHNETLRILHLIANLIKNPQSSMRFFHENQELICEYIQIFYDNLSNDECVFIFYANFQCYALHGFWIYWSISRKCGENAAMLLNEGFLWIRHLLNRILRLDSDSNVKHETCAESCRKLDFWLKENTVRTTRNDFLIFFLVFLSIIWFLVCFKWKLLR